MSRPLARVRLRLLSAREAVEEAQRVLECDADEARGWLTRRGLLNDRSTRPGGPVVNLEAFEEALLVETEPGPGSGRAPDHDALVSYVERPTSAPPRRSSPDERQPRRSSAARERIAMGLGAVLSLDHAAKVLPMDAGVARHWLLAEGLVHNMNGRSVVRWYDVWERLGEQGHEAPAEDNVVLLPRFEREKL